MLSIFSADSRYQKWARLPAVLWTLLIFIGCLMPARHIPKVDAPLIDKWVHLVLFGGFTFLWLLTRPIKHMSWRITMLGCGILLGIIIELLQLTFPALGRAFELLDILADSIGALLGVLLFSLVRR